MTMYTDEGFLYPKPPFDFSKSIDFIHSFKPTEGEQHYKESEIVKAVRLSSISIIFKICSIGTIAKPKLHYQIFSHEPITEKSRTEAEDRISFWLSLDDELNKFYSLAESDPVFQRVINLLYGYHQVKFLTPFENACWAILSTRNNMATARKMKSSLMNKYGTRIEFGTVTHLTFPTAFQLKNVTEEEIHSVIFNRKKAKFLIEVIKAFSQIDEYVLRNQSFEEAKSWLLNIKGIGDWSASFILLRGLGKMDNLPLNEKVLNKSLENLYHFNQNDRSFNIREIAETYKEYQGYWAHYIRAAINMPGYNPLQRKVNVNV